MRSTLLKVALMAPCVIAMAQENPQIVRVEPAEILRWPVNPPRADGDSYFLFRLTIDTKGRVSSVEVADRGFASRRQIAEYSSWVTGARYKPEMRNGEAVESVVTLPLSVSSSTGGKISDRFRKESENVGALIAAGDKPGAVVLAERMRSELVRSRDEYLVLQGILAQAYASAGDHPSALVAARSVTERRKPADMFEPDAPLREKAIDSYQFVNRDYVLHMLDLKLRLSARQGYVLEALQTYAELAALTNISPEDPRAALSSQLALALGSPKPLSAEAVLLADTLEPAKGVWSHLLHRRNFSLEDARGIIRQLSLRCGSQVRELQYGDGLEWTVPQSWSDCSILVRGEPGARFRIVEFADRQDVATTDGMPSSR